MLPSMPILLSASQAPPEDNDEVFKQGPKNENDSDDKDKEHKQVSQTTQLPPQVADTFEILPEEDCDDELVLLADNSPLSEKRRLNQTPSSKKKKRVEPSLHFETNVDDKIMDDLAERVFFSLESCCVKVHPRDLAWFRLCEYSEAYLSKVKSTVDEETFAKFIAALSEVADEPGSAVSLYHKMEEILLDHSDLVDDFVGFLKPCQALECGRLTDLKFITNCLAYFKKLEGHQGTRLVNTIETQVAGGTPMNLESLKTSVLPILKGNSHLLDSFLHLLPDEKPPVPSSRDEYEEISEASPEDGYWERITVPEHPDRGCSLNCTCRCHLTPNQPFCIACNIRFINGQAFVQYGKILRYARLSFGDAPHHEMLRNLHPDLYSKRRKNRKTSVSKAGPAPNKDVPEKEENPLQSKEDVPQFSSPDLDRCDKIEEDDDYWEDENSSDKSSAGDHLDISNEDTHEEFLEDTQDSTRFMDQISKPLSPIGSIAGEDKQESQSCTEIKLEPVEFDSEPVEESAATVSSLGDVKIKEENAVAALEEKQPQDEKGWTREEDKMILQAFQRDFGTEQIFAKISDSMPSRTVLDIQKRFQVLMNLLEKVASGSHETYPV